MSAGPSKDACGASGGRAAWRSPRAWVVLALVSLLGLAADLASKQAAFDRVAGVPVRVDRAEVVRLTEQGLVLDGLLPVHDPVVVVPRVLQLQLVLNKGAVFGLGAGKRWLFVGFTALAVAMCVWTFARWTHAGDAMAHACLGLVLAGGLGNVYDRVVFACVRDFLHPLPELLLPWGLRGPGGSGELWPYVSNVADLFLIVGMGGLVWRMWRTPARAPERAPEGSTGGNG